MGLAEEFEFVLLCGVIEPRSLVAPLHGTQGFFLTDSTLVQPSSALVQLDHISGCVDFKLMRFTLLQIEEESSKPLKYEVIVM